MTDSSIPPIIPIPPEDDEADMRGRWKKAHALTPEQVSLGTIFSCAVPNQ